MASRSTRADPLAGLGLVAANAGDPGVEALNSVRVGPDLAKVAAEVGIGAPKLVAEQPRLLLRGELGLVAYGLDGVAPLHLFHVGVGLGEEEVGIEVVDLEPWVDLDGDIEDHRAGSTPEAHRQRDTVAEGIECPAEDVGGGMVFKAV